jgi:hypothetical protein
MFNFFLGEKGMLNINGKMYVKGYVKVSPAALARLRELGVELHSHRSHDSYNSFFLPEGQDGGEFLHRPGCPRSPGELYLKSEVGD